MLSQMMGRAGRPGFDTTGVAIVMTDNGSAESFKHRITRSEVIESQLAAKLSETLNCEISQGVITSSAEALEWLRGTFFYVRVKMHPHKYGIKPGLTDVALDAHLENVCLMKLQELYSVNLIQLDAGAVEPRPPCHVMCKHIVPLQAMKCVHRHRTILCRRQPLTLLARSLRLMLGIDGATNFSTSELLHVLSSCELLQVPLRRSEKKVLNELHTQTRYRIKSELPPSKIKVQDPAHKTFVLLQCAIGQLELGDYSMRQVRLRAKRAAGAVEEAPVPLTRLFRGRRRSRWSTAPCVCSPPARSSPWTTATTGSWRCCLSS